MLYKFELSHNTVEITKKFILQKQKEQDYNIRVGKFELKSALALNRSKRLICL